MKVEVIRVFFDNNGLHRVGEIVEVENFDENLMKPIKENTETIEKVEKKPTRKKIVKE